MGTRTPYTGDRNDKDERVRRWLFSYIAREGDNMTHEELMRELNRILNYIFDDDEKPKKQDSGLKT